MRTVQTSGDRALHLVSELPATDEAIRRQVNSLAARSGSGREALIPLVREIKRTWGSVPLPALDEIALVLDMDYAKVHSVAAFYDLLERIDRKLPTAS
ncbi:MAG: hypothetical protein A2W26_07325 [Acidobacteria bacterium RBG_16_64_8]|nr:MAG: hypothetical protein A2W26_07325 [Acidobacteria bacterium RBG_16_64_8]